MLRPKLVGLSLVIAVASVPQIGEGRTVLAMLYANCPNASALRNATEQADEAAAVKDADQFVKSREAARQYYRCSRAVSDAYAHDWAKFVYADYLWTSLKTNGDVRDNATSIADIVDGLANTSKFTDVIESSVSLRDDIDKELARVNRLLTPP